MMISSAIYLCLGLLVVHSLQQSKDTQYMIEKQFISFTDEYRRQYEPGSQEYERKLNIFKTNVIVSKKLNDQRDNSSAWYGVTKFADLTQEEFQTQYLSDISHTPGPTLTHLSNSTSSLSFSSRGYHKVKRSPGRPAKWDWRDKNAVTPVKNQKSCGGCWAFSTVETTESMRAIQTGRLQALSVQEVIDCSYGSGPLYGCKGGDTCAALKWMLTTQTPLVSEPEYPLTDKAAQECKLINTNHTKGVTLKSITCKNYVGKEDALLDILYHVGPVAVSVDASSWNNYLGGIIKFHCESHNNHAVAIVGYDTTGPVPYYIVKNSWGPDWGIGGYVHIMVGNAVCGLVKEVSTVQIKT